MSSTSEGDSTLVSGRRLVLLMAQLLPVGEQQDEE